MSDLGELSISLAVADLDASLAFYETLSFEVSDGGHDSEAHADAGDARWRVLQQGRSRIGLFQGMFDLNTITFDHDDVRAVQRRLKSRGVRLSTEALDGEGPAHAVLHDPDGNPILLSQHA